MKNLTKRVKIRFVNNAKICKIIKKYIREPIFLSQKIFSTNFFIIHEIKPVLTFYNPIYVGFSILYLSKLLIYKYHYKYVKTKYDNCANLLLTDTGILAYEIETDDVYEDFHKN